MGSFSIWHWLIVLVIVVMVFGTKKLRGMGSDLGSAVKGFKDGNAPPAEEPAAQNSAQVANQTAVQPDKNTIDVQARAKS